MDKIVFNKYWVKLCDSFNVMPSYRENQKDIVFEKLSKMKWHERKLSLVVDKLIENEKFPILKDFISIGVQFKYNNQSDIDKQAEKRRLEQEEWKWNQEADKRLKSMSDAEKQVMKKTISCYLPPFLRGVKNYGDKKGLWFTIAERSWAMGEWDKETEGMEYYS